MKATTQDETPVAIAGEGVELRVGPIGGGMSAGWVQAAQGTDLRPALVGLKDDLCQCPHWGYVISGVVRMHTPDGPSDYAAGQAFYWGPGHAPEVLEDVLYVDFSPTDEFDHVLTHLKGG